MSTQAAQQLFRGEVNVNEEGSRWMPAWMHAFIISCEGQSGAAGEHKENAH